jgi:peptidyl-prolyl cis-trans isomerase C
MTNPQFQMHRSPARRSHSRSVRKSLSAFCHRSFFRHSALVLCHCLTFLFLACLIRLTASAAPAERPLFDDPVVARTKSFSIRDSEVQEAYVNNKAAAAAIGQSLAGASEDALKQQALDKMIATKILLARATPQDREDGRKTVERLISETKERAGSEATFRRRLLAVGSSPEEYEKELLEQATVQAVIDRELRKKEIVTDSDIRKYYNEHAASYREPEKARVLHILFATRKIPGGEPLPADQRLAKKTAAMAAVTRARKGEDFARLVQELSDDPESKKQNGELTFSRGSGIVPAQFEAAAFSLEPGKISDPVQTVFGFHIIKLVEKLPPTNVPVEKVYDRIRAGLQREAVQKKLPDFLAQLKKEAGLEILVNYEDRK